MPRGVAGTRLVASRRHHDEADAISSWLLLRCGDDIRSIRICRVRANNNNTQNNKNNKNDNTKQKNDIFSRDSPLCVPTNAKRSTPNRRYTSQTVSPCCHFGPGSKPMSEQTRPPDSTRTCCNPHRHREGWQQTAHVRDCLFDCGRCLCDCGQLHLPFATGHTNGDDAGHPRSARHHSDSAVNQPRTATPMSRAGGSDRGSPPCPRGSGLCRWPPAGTRHAAGDACS